MFLFLSLPWIILTIAALLLLFAVVSDDHWALGLVFMAVWLAAFGFFGDLNVSPKNVVVGTAIYIPIGIFYIFVRWYFYVSGLKYDFEIILLNYAKDNGFDLVDGKIPKEHRKEFTKWFKDYHYSFDINPKAWKQKHKITTWGMWWPISAPIWLFGDIIADIWKFIINNLTNILTNISKRIWPDVEDNFDD